MLGLHAQTPMRTYLGLDVTCVLDARLTAETSSVRHDGLRLAGLERAGSDECEGFRG